MEKVQSIVCKGFGVKNMLRKDIVTQNVFFNKSEEVFDQLKIKCSHFSYTHLPFDDAVKSRIENNESMIIKDCMKQNLMVFTKNEPVLCKEYLCSSSSCLEFIFKECLGDEAPLCSELSCLDYYGDDEDVVNKTEQIFDFTAVPSFVSLFSGRQNEPCTLHKLQKKVLLKKISLIHLVTLQGLVENFSKDIT